MITTKSPTVKTRILILSDTHTCNPLPPSDTQHPYRHPLPPCDVLIHCGDITSVGYASEYAHILEFLEATQAELKLVIAGNHDITLHEDFYVQRGVRKHQNQKEDLGGIREMWCGEDARRFGVVYLEEGVKAFELKSGVRFTVYASPWQPEFEDWAFTYPRHVDRFNPTPPAVKEKAANPVPNHPHIDIMLTHGPPKDILDKTYYQGENVGCEHLREAAERCKPRIHCFGHIHEGWGAERVDWTNKKVEKVETPWNRVVENRCSYVDLSSDGGNPLKWGEETLFVNAAIMDVHYNPTNAPWIIDLDLPMRDNGT